MARKRSKEVKISPRLRHIQSDLERIIVREGFLHLDTASVAKRLQCSKRALYALAPTQERLMVQLIDRVLSRTDKYLAGVAKSAPSWRSALTNYMAALVQTSRPASVQFLTDIAVFPPGMKLLSRLQKRTADRLEQIIRSGIAARVFNDVSPKLVAELVLMAAARLINPAFLRSLGLTLAEAYEELSRLVDHGLLPHLEADVVARIPATALADGSRPPLTRPSRSRSTKQRGKASTIVGQ